MDPDALRQAILERLGQVIDPETGVDVVRMRLVEDLAVDEGGRVSCTFRPSSVLCPLAVPLSLAMRQAIAQVQGVADVDLQVVGYIGAEQLTRLIKEALGGR